MRRTFLGLLGALALVGSTLMGTAPALAQGAFPNRPVKIIVPYPAGGSVDPVARFLGDKLSAIWGQAVVIDNRAGANTIIGTDAAAKSPADGYTILLTANTHVSNPMMYKSLPFDSVADFAPVASVNIAEFVLTTYAAFKGDNLKEVIAELKAHPGKYSYPTGGVGGITHLAMEMFQVQTGTKIVHVPYKGPTQFLPDLANGQVALYLAVPITVAPLLQSGKLKAIATTSTLGNPPGVKTFAEQGMPEFQVRSWLGFLAPAKTPKDVIAKLNADINRVLAMPDVRDRLQGQGQIIWISTPDEFAASMRRDAVEYAKMIKYANIQPE